MPRLRLTIKHVLEYDADPADYAQDPAEITAEEMAEIDREQTEDDPFSMLQHEDGEFTVTCEVVG